MTDWDLIQVLYQIGHHVEHLNLRGCNNLAGLAFQSVKVNCTSLKTIDVSESTVTNVNLKELFINTKKFPVLESITCESMVEIRRKDFYVFCCEAYQVGRSFTAITNPYPTGLHPDREEDIINPGLLQVAALFTQLQSLTASNSNIRGLSLEAVCRHNPGIHTLIISECQGLSESIAQCVSHLTSLTELDISHTVTSDATFMTVVKHQPNLRKINISGCSRITDIGISKLSDTCKNVTSFIANKSPHQNGTITDFGLLMVAEGCRCLKELSLVSCPGVSDRSMQSVAKNCQNLKSVNVIKCLALTDDTFLALSENCRNLETLKASECVKITCVSVNALVRNCTKLHELELDTCHYLSKLHFQDEETKQATADENNSTHYFFHSCLISSPCRLRVLDLSFCSQIATDSVNQIASYCVTLRNLSLRGCYLITDIAIEALAQKCLLLTVLDISGSSISHSKLTDRSLVALADHARNLVMLSITKTSLSTAGVITLIQKCDTLRRLQVESGKSVKVKDVINATRRFKRTCSVQGHKEHLMDTEYVRGPVLLTMPPLRYAIWGWLSLLATMFWILYFKQCFVSDTLLRNA